MGDKNSKDTVTVITEVAGAESIDMISYDAQEVDAATDADNKE